MERECIVFIGPPGAGKGTQAKRVASRRGILHVAAGDVLRHPEYGGALRAYADAGTLAPDEAVFAAIRRRLAQPDAASGFVLDGFPRTLAQFALLHGNSALPGALPPFLVPDAIVMLEVPDDVIVERVSQRLYHEPSGRSYHPRFCPPQRAGYDDGTGDPLTARPDDAEPKVRRRLLTYHAETEPLVMAYRALPAFPQFRDLRLAAFDGTLPPDRLEADIARFLAGS